MEHLDKISTWVGQSLCHAVLLHLISTKHVLTCVYMLQEAEYNVCSLPDMADSMIDIIYAQTWM